MEDAAALLPGCRAQPGADREAGRVPALVAGKQVSNQQVSGEQQCRGAAEAAMRSCLT